MEHFINFPVGDWSEDGHNQCHWFMVLSNKSIDEVKDIHLGASEKLGFDIGDICRNYEDSELSLDIFDKLKEAGFPIEWEGENPEFEKYFEDTDERTMTSREVFNLWIDILKFLDPSLEIVEVKHGEMCIFGQDEKGRHLNTPGYGTFWN